MIYSTNMEFIADLHIHSKYARATSPKMNLAELDRFAQDKGITLMGTGDFTHPDYFAEIEEQLEPAEPGLYKLKKDFQLPMISGELPTKTRFILSSEISSIYTREGRGRRIHTLFYLPSLAAAAKFNQLLEKNGANLRSDGRPIVGLDVRKIVDLALTADSRALIIPAHIWTPWFSMFGSKSGFNSIQECFGEYTKQIFAVETGLSSDPLMNWRVSQLDSVALISNSDSHSLERIGREANIFNTELSYDGVVAALKNNTPEKFVATLEYFPEEGRYHFDGHRQCRVCWSPEKTRKNRGICSVCGKPVTIGVLNRLDKLADRGLAEIPLREVQIGVVSGKTTGNRIPFVNLITLDTLLAQARGVVGVKTQTVKKIYEHLIREVGSELYILLKAPLAEIGAASDDRVLKSIKRMREQKFWIEPGYDGEYGKVQIFSAKEQKAL